MTESIQINQALNKASEIFLGKESKIKLALVSLLADGHLLIEDIPGVGKTTLVYLLGKLFNLNVSRIQFTNDLLPADILGTMIFDRESGSFSYNKGPIFGNLILADELNRANPKTQSALLQVMEERSITIEGETYQMDAPFIVMATQNPNQYIGTFELPESQLDRFFMSMSIDLPSRNYEKEIITGGPTRYAIDSLTPLFDKFELVSMRKNVEKIHVSQEILDYILDLIEEGRRSTTDHSNFSVRASIDLTKASKAMAFLNQRDYVTPDDVQAVAPSVLGHRIAMGTGIKRGRIMIEEIIRKVEV